MHSQTVAAWQEFWHTGRCVQQAVSPPIMRSWQRCAARGLDPYTPIQAMPRPLSAAQQAFLIQARSSIEDLYQFIEQPGFAVILTDAHCLIVDVQGDGEMLADIGRLGVAPGANFAEEWAGTNAIDLALREAQPIQTCGAEHYCRCYHDIALAAAPIFDVGGQALGALGIITRATLAHPHTLGLAIAATQALHNQLRNEDLLAEANDHLAELYATLETMSEGLIFISPQGDIRRINSRAAHMLGLNARTIAGRPLDEVVSLPTLVRLALQKRQELSEQELFWQGRKSGTAAMCSLRPVWDRGRRYLGALIILRPAQSVQQLVHRVVGAHAQFTFHDIIGHSQPMLQALHQAHLAANSTACVMLKGEPGVGREMFAQAIHNASSRATGPYISLNCAAVPRALLPSELFGVEGSDSSSEPGRPGKLELAHGGVLFLEEVGALSFDLQTSLLRTIEMRHVIRTNGTRATPIDVRIIATGWADLERQTQEGRFRADLAARLSAFTVEIPALCERGDDLLLLANHLLLLLGERLGKQVVLAPDAMQALRSYHWPGNVRELELTLERLLHSTEKSVIALDDLPAQIVRAAQGATNPSLNLARPKLADSQAMVECDAIVRAGRQAAGHLGRTAELLGISRATLWRKMARYGLTKEHFWQ